MSDALYTLDMLSAIITDTPLKELIGSTSDLFPDHEGVEPSGYVCGWSDYAVIVKQVAASGDVTVLDDHSDSTFTLDSNKTLTEVLQKLHDLGLDDVEGNISIAQTNKLLLQRK